MPLAQKYCAGLVSCGWEPTIAGAESPERALRGLALFAETETGIPVAFLACLPAALPTLRLTAMSVDLTLTPPRRTEALFTATVPGLRALIAMGWDTMFVPRLPVDVLPIVHAMDTSGIFGHDDSDARREIESTGGSVRGRTLPRRLTLPLASWLTFVERRLRL